MNRFLMGFVYCLFLPVLLIGFPLFWLTSRLTAQRCTNCRSKWKTELMGEWDGYETWNCHRCGQWWDVPYFADKVKS